MLWACILLPQLALDGVLRRHRRPDAPLALVAGPAQRRVLQAVNAAAAAQGLRPGQSLAAAQVLAVDFETVDYDPAAEMDWQQFLAAWAYRYSSQVSVDFAEAVLLEVGASLGLFGPWPDFERRLREELRELGFTHRIAVAPVPRAAWVLAGARDGGQTVARLEAERKAGEGESRATGLRSAPGCALAAIPIAQARIDPAVAAALHGMGLRRLGQLFAAPRAALGKRFGPGLLDHLDRLRGLAPEPLNLYRPPDRFDLRLELAYEVESSQALLFPLRRLTGDLAAFLAGRDGGVQRFVLRLEHEGHADTQVPVGLLAAERDPALLFELARSRLERTAVPAPVRGLRLVAAELPPFVPAGRELFDPRPAQAVPWPALRERLRARLGEEAVHVLAPADEHRPERVARTVARLEAEPKAGADARQEADARPTWLLPRPIPLREPAPRILAGPERLETGWWDGGDVRRDYYIVETASGQRAWAFCAPGERGPFMLHGWFA